MQICYVCHIYLASENPDMKWGMLDQNVFPAFSVVRVS